MHKIVRNRYIDFYKRKNRKVYIYSESINDVIHILFLYYFVCNYSHEKIFSALSTVHNCAYLIIFH